MNSENLGVRITKNGALDQKLWALEAFRGKTVFRRLWGNSRIFRVVEGSWRENTGALAKFGNFQEIFVDFWSV
jgi:hypothetical protein